MKIPGNDWVILSGIEEGISTLCSSNGKGGKGCQRPLEIPRDFSGVCPLPWLEVLLGSLWF